MKAYGTMALQHESDQEREENGCVGCQKMKEEELKKKTAKRNGMLSARPSTSASFQSKSLFI